MKVANVIYEKELVNHTKSEYVNYFNEHKAYDDLDKSLPTLYVGWKFMKASNPENPLIQNADILKKKIITNELYWEFDFQESKASHVKGVDTFVGLAPQFYFNPKYKYTNLDPVFFQLKDVQDIMDVLPKKIVKYYLFKNSMIYVLSDDNIYGINLDMYRFFKFDIDDLMKKLESLTFVGINDTDGSKYEEYYKLFPNFEQLKRYLITILDN